MQDGRALPSSPTVPGKFRKAEQHGWGEFEYHDRLHFFGGLVIHGLGTKSNVRRVSREKSACCSVARKSPGPARCEAAPLLVRGPRSPTAEPHRVRVAPGGPVAREPFEAARPSLALCGRERPCSQAGRVRGARAPRRAAAWACVGPGLHVPVPFFKAAKTQAPAAPTRDSGWRGRWGAAGVRRVPGRRRSGPPPPPLAFPDSTGARREPGPHSEAPAGGFGPGLVRRGRAARPRVGRLGACSKVFQSEGCARERPKLC